MLKYHIQIHSPSSDHENNRDLAMRMLLKQHPKLYDFLIHPDSKWPNDAADVLIERANIFSSGERILIKIGLDLCFNQSQSSLWNIVNRLDSTNFRNVLEALIYMRTSTR
jgi:hypothetical protein